LTVQNTSGVTQIEPVRGAWIEAALESLSADNRLSVIKIGVLYSLDAVRIAVSFLQQHPDVPVVLDPVLRASSGTPLLEADALETFSTQLVPLSTWLTPNLDELAALIGQILPEPVSRPWIESQARKLSERAPKTNIFITGGHLGNPDDFLLLPGQTAGTWIEGQKVPTRATHGTGCTLASAIAARLARWPQETSLETATAAKRYVEGAMRNAPGIGRGAGPLEHFWEHRT
jgi:hydroxymethylpyrimidine/phosphomethylpyrimidine kinase